MISWTRISKVPQFLRVPETPKKWLPCQLCACCTVSRQHCVSAALPRFSDFVCPKRKESNGHLGGPTPLTPRGSRQELQASPDYPYLWTIPSNWSSRKLVKGEGGQAIQPTAPVLPEGVDLEALRGAGLRHRHKHRPLPSFRLPGRKVGGLCRGGRGQAPPVRLPRRRAAGGGGGGGPGPRPGEPDALPPGQRGTNPSLF